MIVFLRRLSVSTQPAQSNSFPHVLMIPLRLDLFVCIAYRRRNTQGLKKEIPGTPEHETPVHLRDRQIFSTKATSKRIKDPRAGKPEESKAKAES